LILSSICRRFESASSCMRTCLEGNGWFLAGLLLPQLLRLDSSGYHYRVQEDVFFFEREKTTVPSASCDCARASGSLLGCCWHFYFDRWQD
jgi:hypothetical protein